MGQELEAGPITQFVAGHGGVFESQGGAIRWSEDHGYWGSLWRLDWVSTGLRPRLPGREEGSKDPISVKSSNLTQRSRH